MNLLLELRLLLAVAGFVLIAFLRPWLVRSIDRGRRGDALASIALVALALLAACIATEAILRMRAPRFARPVLLRQEPQLIPDHALGWTVAPNHFGEGVAGGRTVHYFTNAQGYRIPAANARIDVVRPAILLAGESIVFGYGLEWSETIAAQLAALTGIQTVDMAVNGHATDQSYLRLRSEIRRFQRPVAIVILFAPILIDRNLDLDRPHLDTQLHWQPAKPAALRLIELVQHATRYRSADAIDDGILMTRRALAATIALARSRHAHAIILVPQLLPETGREREIRHVVLDLAHLPYRLVPLPPTWRLKGDPHPDSRGARAMAEAIMMELRQCSGSNDFVHFSTAAAAC